MSSVKNRRHRPRPTAHLASKGHARVLMKLETLPRFLLLKPPER